MTLQAKLDERMKLVTAAREILDAAPTSGLTADEETKYNAMDADIEALGTEIDAIRSVQEKRTKLSSIEDMISSEPAAAPAASRTATGDRHTRTQDRRHEFRAWLLAGATGETRAMEAGTNSEGGFSVGQEFNATIVETMDDLSVIRQLATVVQTSGDHNITVETSAGAGEWVDEEGGYTDTNPVFARVTLGAFKAAALVKVSEELLQDNVINLEAYLARTFARRLSVLEETAFASGDGSGKPTGLTAQVSGNNTAAAAVAAVTSDELLDVYYALGNSYRGQASWLANDGLMKLIRKLKDGDNQYLWQPGLQADTPDVLLGRPIYPQLGMPAATAGLIPLLFGDISYVTVADRGAMTLQRLNELYAGNGQVGFRLFKRTDMKLTSVDAFAKLTMAAS